MDIKSEANKRLSAHRFGLGAILLKGNRKAERHRYTSKLGYSQYCDVTFYSPLTMSGFSAFLKPGNTPSTPASTPLSAPSSTPSTTPATQLPITLQTQQLSQPQSNAFATSSITSLPTTASYTSATSGSSAASIRLREIAQQSQKLNETIRAGSADLPKLELSLGMIREKARDMSRRAGGAGRENMQQAYPGPL